MGTRHHQTVIDKNGELKLSQYGQWDGYPSGQGQDILTYLKTGNLDKYQNELSKVRKANYTDYEIVNSDIDWKMNYPHMSRDCGAKIHQIIENGEVEFVTWIELKESRTHCDGFYQIDFQKRIFRSEFHGKIREYSIDDLPDNTEYVKAFESSE